MIYTETRCAIRNKMSKTKMIIITQERTEIFHKRIITVNQQLKTHDIIVNITTFNHTVTQKPNKQ